MGIWVEMTKFNLQTKEYVQSSGDTSSEFSSNIQIETENTTDYKKISTFIPKLNGIVSSIRINFKVYKSGSSGGNTSTIQIRDTGGNVIKEISQDTGKTPYIIFENIEVSALRTYEIYFKNSLLTSGIYSIFIPENIRVSYFVKEKNNNYFTINAN